MTRRPEQQVQRAVIQHLAWWPRPGVWWTHISLGGLRSKVEAAILRGLGTARGTLDVLIVPDGKAHLLELSARSHVTFEQRGCNDALRAAARPSPWQPGSTPRSHNSRTGDF